MTSVPDRSYVQPITSLDRKVIACEQKGANLSIFDTATGRMIGEIGSEYTIKSKALSPDGRLLALATGFTELTDVLIPGEVAIRVIRVADGKEIQKFERYDRSISCLCFSPDGKTLAVASHDRTLRLWEVATGKLRIQLPAAKQLITTMVFSPQGRLLATADSTATISAWECEAH